MSDYHGEPGGPHDPSTPGGYCLGYCLCGNCPQHAEQVRRVDVLREQEYGQRVAREGEKSTQHRNYKRSAA